MSATAHAADLRSRYIDVESMDWESTHFPGVEMKLLYNDPASGFSTMLFRMAPGARIPPHEHTSVEQTYVLEGTFADDEGKAVAGNFIWRPAGSQHSAYTPDGAVILAFFTKPNRFFEGQKFFTKGCGSV